MLERFFYPIRLSSFLLFGLAFGAIGVVVAVEPGPGSPDVLIQNKGPELAIWDRAVVTRADLVAYLKVNVPPEDRYSFLQNEERVQDLLRNLLRPRGVARAGLESGMMEDPIIRSEVYQAAMNFLAEQWLERVADRGELDSYEQQAREIYLREREQFRTDETFDFTHLLISEDNTTARNDGEADPPEVFDEIRAQLDDGAGFEKLVAKFSEDPSISRNQGSFEGIAAERLDPAFAEALSRLDTGEISQPVKTRFGWHLIRLDGVNAAEIPRFEKIAARLEQRARQKHRNDLKAEFQTRELDGPLQIIGPVLDEIREDAKNGTLDFE